VGRKGIGCYRSTKIKAGTLKTQPLDENPFADWSAALFVAGRAQYILLSNTKRLGLPLLFLAIGLGNLVWLVWFLWSTSSR